MYCRYHVAVVLLLGWSTLGLQRLAAAVDLWVSPTGDDAAAGTAEQPFATLEEARDAVRAARAQGAAGPVTVWIHGGVYRRTSTFKLERKDAGTREAPVIDRAVPGAMVSIRGGREIPESWCRCVDDASIRVRLVPEVRDQVVRIDLRAHGVTDYGEMSILAPMLELFCAGKRLPLARWPNDRWAKIGKVVAVAEDGTRQLVDGNKRGTTFRDEGDRPRRWLRAEAIELHGFWWFGWMDEHVRIARIDAERQEIELACVPGGGIRSSQWFRALNLLEEIDEPGEWYLDRADGVLYVLPPAEYPALPLVISELAEPLLAIHDAPHITIRGLTFEVTRGVAIVIGGSRESRLAGSVVRGVGSDAIAIDHGVENGILGCDIHDIGGMAIRITGGNRTTLEPANNYVVNSHSVLRHEQAGVYRRWPRQCCR